VGLTQHHFTGKKHIKSQEEFDLNKDRTGPAEEKGQGEGSHESFSAEKKKELAFKESYVTSMKSLLCDVIQDTMNQIRKKKTRTIEENMAENNYEENEPEVESDSSDDEPTYNPKNLPLGWDGK
jgi:splicing factor 3A subunit 3